MTEPKPLEPASHLPKGPADPSAGLPPERLLEALDIHGEGMPETRAAEGPLKGRTTIIERQDSWNNRRDAARDIGPPTSARRNTSQR
ncbi:MAG: hypothetical protein ABI627_01100 [Polyangiaceae bacterium]